MTPLDPGWYRDPDNPKWHRYWNGSAWKDAAAPAERDTLDHETRRPDPLRGPDSRMLLQRDS